MKALVLAGGTGTRLRPISYSMPKQLIPVANKPVLFHCLGKIRNAGITDVGLVVNESDVQIRACVGDGSPFGLRVTFIPQRRPLGLAHAVRIAQPFLGSESFLMYLGDNILVDEILEQVHQFHAEKPAAQILVAPVARPSEYGIVELDGSGRIVSLEEKPSNPRSDLAVIGVYFFTPAVHDVIRTLTPSTRGELEITDAIRGLIATGSHVSAVRITGYWKDTGRVEDLLDCNRALLNDLEPSCEGALDSGSEVLGAVRIGPGARIIRSRIVGPVVLGANAFITDCTIGPHVSVGDDAVLARTTMSESIALERARIEDVDRIRDSLIGRDAQVVRSRQHRIVTGDHSRIELIA